MKLKKFEPAAKHVDNIPIEAVNLDSEDTLPPKPDKPIARNIFQPNSKYFTIVVYALFFVLGSILIYKFIGNWNSTVKAFKNIFSILSPFLIGAMIALILYPFIKTLYNKFFLKVCHIKSRKLAKLLLGLSGKARYKRGAQRNARHLRPYFINKRRKAFVIALAVHPL